MNKNIAVLGIGAIGSSVGADLTKAGYNVMLIEQWPAHVEAMKASGLHVTIANKEELHTPVQAAHLCEVCSLHRQFDTVFLASKSYDSLWLTQFIKPYLKSDGVLVSMQNSMNDEWIAPIIGYERDIACCLELSAEMFQPGRIKRNTDHVTTKFVVGELHGRITPRLQEVAQILSHVGRTEVSSNIWGAKWSKLVVNTMSMEIDAILGIPMWELQDPKLLGLCIRLGKETMRVGNALGYVMEPIIGLTAQDFMGAEEEVLKRILMKMLIDLGKTARSCVLQDLLKGRPTEAGDYLNGLVVKKGREAGIPTPLNEAIVTLIKQMEEGKLKPDPANRRLLEPYL